MTRITERSKSFIFITEHREVSLGPFTPTCVMPFFLLIFFIFALTRDFILPTWFGVTQAAFPS